jgi:hypothetical protein
MNKSLVSTEVDNLSQRKMVNKYISHNFYNARIVGFLKTYSVSSKLPDMNLKLNNHF